MVSSPAVLAGEQAVAALDLALAHRPARDGEAFSAATEHLCRLRDLLIAECRAGRGVEDCLGRVNAVLSAALAGHFPLGKTPWPVVEQAQQQLRSVVVELGAP